MIPPQAPSQQPAPSHSEPACRRQGTLPTPFPAQDRAHTACIWSAFHDAGRENFTRVKASTGGGGVRGAVAVEGIKRRETARFLWELLTTSAETEAKVTQGS